MRKRHAGRIAALAVLGAVPTVLLASPAYAATGVAKVGNQIVANAANNRANNITITRVGVFVQLRDLGDVMNAGPGCFRVSANTVRCRPPVNRIVINTGNRNDRVDNLTNIPLTANGGLGNDTLLGGSGADRLSGANGNDTLRGRFGGDTLLGGGGTDRAVAEAVRDGRDTFSGGTGRDTTDYALRVIGVNVTLNGVANDGSAPEFDNNLANVENAIGGRAGDRLTGNAAANNLQGRAGSDTLLGGNGNDTLLGGAGRDAMFGQNGRDTLLARDGLRDTAVNGGAGLDRCNRDAIDPRTSCELP